MYILYSRCMVIMLENPDFALHLYVYVRVTPSDGFEPLVARLVKFNSSADFPSIDGLVNGLDENYIFKTLTVGETYSPHPPFNIYEKLKNKFFIFQIFISTIRSMFIRLTILFMNSYPNLFCLLITVARKCK